MAKRVIERNECNCRLLKSYGSWLYCKNCSKTVAYICYTTYTWIEVQFECICGANGKIELHENGVAIPAKIVSRKQLALNNNRYCCSNDDTPLFSIVAKQINSVDYKVSCLNCGEEYCGTIQANHSSL